jgi:hypothetical protein
MSGRSFKSFLNESFIDKFYKLYQSSKEIISKNIRDMGAKGNVDLVSMADQLSNETKQFGPQMEVVFRISGSINGEFRTPDEIYLGVPTVHDSIWNKPRTAQTLLSTFIHEFIHSRQKLTPWKTLNYETGGRGLDGAKYIFQDIEFQPWVQGIVLKFSGVPVTKFYGFIDYLVDDVPRLILPDDIDKRINAYWDVSQAAIKKYNLPDDTYSADVVSYLINAYYATFIEGDHSLQNRAKSWASMVKKQFSLFNAYQKRFG